MTIYSLNRTEPAATFSLRSPDALISAIPYLLGFHPAESIVIVWLRADEIRLTQRVDLPIDEGAVGLGEFAEAIAAPWRHANADEVAICVFSNRHGAGQLPFAQLMSTLIVVLHGLGVGVVDALLVGDPGQASRSGNTKRWWSYLGDDESHELDEKASDLVQSRFAMHEVSVLPNRGALESAFDPDVEGGHRIAELIDAQIAELSECVAAKTLSVWRDENISTVLRLVLSPGGSPALSSAQSARLIFCLHDIRVRDTMLWHLVKSADLRTALLILTSATRTAPPGMLAPIATCTAICAWLIGDGARALVALERGQDDDPEYPLANLVAQGLAAGLPPSTWASAMAEVTEEQCRTGATAS